MVNIFLHPLIRTDDEENLKKAIIAETFLSAVSGLTRTEFNKNSEYETTTSYDVNVRESSVVSVGFIART